MSWLLTRAWPWNRYRVSIVVSGDEIREDHVWVPTARLAYHSAELMTQTAKRKALPPGIGISVMITRRGLKGPLSIRTWVTG